TGVGGSVPATDQTDSIARKCRPRAVHARPKSRLDQKSRLRRNMRASLSAQGKGASSLATGRRAASRDRRSSRLQQRAGCARAALQRARDGGGLAPVVGGFAGEEERVEQGLRKRFA